MKKLTIGSLVYDDFEGIYFSYQSMRLNNQDILDDLDFVVIDNNPDSAEGKATKGFCEKSNINYKTYTDKRSTSLRNLVFDYAEAPYTLCIDPHVLFETNTLKNLIKFYEDNPDTKDLYHGPMLMDCIKGHDPMTHMEPVWRDNMFGTWGMDKRGNDPENEPFEIPMHGMGIFTCKTDQWLRFNKDFIGFGGEEGYIHEKYRQSGRKTMNLPWLRWLHRFDRPRGVPYSCILEERIYNYFIGFKELGKDPQEIIDHFKKTAPAIDTKNILDNLEAMKGHFLKKNK